MTAVVRRWHFRRHSSCKVCLPVPASEARGAYRTERKAGTHPTDARLIVIGMYAEAVQP